MRVNCFILVELIKVGGFGLGMHTNCIPAALSLSFRGLGAKISPKRSKAIGLMQLNFFRRQLSAQTGIPTFGDGWLRVPQIPGGWESWDPGYPQVKPCLIPTFIQNHNRIVRPKLLAAI